MTALYEIFPFGQKIENKGMDKLKYSKVESSSTHFSDELSTVKLRYKEPKETESELLTQGLPDNNGSIENASDNLKLASAVAEFGLPTCGSLYKSRANFDQVSMLTGSDNEMI